MKRFFMYYCLILLLAPLTGDDTALLTGFNAYAQGDWDDAVTAFEKAVQESPQRHSEVLYWLVMAHASAKHYEKTLDYADYFLEKYAGDELEGEVLYQKGLLCSENKKYEQATETFHILLRKYPQHPKVPSAYYWIAENEYAQGSFEKARKSFMQILRQYPKSAKLADAKQKIDLIDTILHTQHTRAYLPANTQHQENAHNQPASKSEKTSKKPVAQQGNELKTKSDTPQAQNLQKEMAAMERDLQLLQRIRQLEQKVHHISDILTNLADKEAGGEDPKKLQDKYQTDLYHLKERVKILKQLYEQRIKGDTNETEN